MSENENNQNSKKKNRSFASSKAPPPKREREEIRRSGADALSEIAHDADRSREMNPDTGELESRTAIDTVREGLIEGNESMPVRPNSAEPVESPVTPTTVLAGSAIYAETTVSRPGDDRDPAAQIGDVGEAVIGDLEQAAQPGRLPNSLRREVKITRMREGEPNFDEGRAPLQVAQVLLPAGLKTIAPCGVLTPHLPHLSLAVDVSPQETADWLLRGEHVRDILQPDREGAVHLGVCPGMVPIMMAHPARKASKSPLPTGMTLETAIGLFTVVAGWRWRYTGGFNSLRTAASDMVLHLVELADTYGLEIIDENPAVAGAIQGVAEPTTVYRHARVPATGCFYTADEGSSDVSAAPVHVSVTRTLLAATPARTHRAEEGGGGWTTPQRLKALGEKASAAFERGEDAGGLAALDFTIELGTWMAGSGGPFPLSAWRTVDTTPIFHIKGIVDADIKTSRRGLTQEDFRRILELHGSGQRLDRLSLKDKLKPSLSSLLG